MSSQFSVKQIDSIDLLKFILSIFIMAGHSTIFSDINTTAAIIARTIWNTGVSSFFVISGFLLGCRLLSAENEKEVSSVLLRTIKRIAVMWILWEIIYIPFMVYSIVSGTSVKQIIISKVLLGSFAHLWFLRASAVAVFIIWIFKKIRIPDKPIVVIALIIHIVGAYMLSISHNTFFRNGIFFAFPYYTMGILVAFHRDKLLSCNTKNLLIITSGIIVLYTIENILMNVGQSTFVLPFVCALILVYFLRSGITLKNALLLRHISTLNYTVHFTFFSILSHLTRSGSIHLNSVGIFAGTVVCTLIASLTIIALQKRIKFLKILY